MFANPRARIAYAIQNVGGINFREDVGDTVPIKQTLLRLPQAGFQVSCFQLMGREVLRYDDIADLANVRRVPQGLSCTTPFKVLESGVRRLQKMAGLSYYAVIDSYRFYEAMYRALPHYDLCHEHNGLFCIGAALACRKLGIPYVLTFSADLLLERRLVGKPLKGLHARVAEAEARYTYRLARKILCVSRAAKRHLIENWQVPAEKIVVMPNGVDVDLFKPDESQGTLRCDLGLQDRQVIAFVGGFQPWHGLELLVESFAIVLSQVPSARLLLVGDGRARPSLERAIREFDVESKVIITGLVPQAQVPAHLSLADVAVMPYPELPQELWFSPLKMYEYMAAGKAIVASRAGQISEVIQDGHSGILVKPGDVHELAGALIRLLKSPQERKRLGRNARQQAVEKHSWQQYIRRLETIYLEALDQ